MKIGFPTFPRGNIIKEIEWIGKNGFDFVDLFIEEDQIMPEKIDIKKTKQAIDKYKLGVVGHTAWYMPIGSPSRALRDAAIKEISRAFRVFEKLGAKYVTVHANWPSGMFSTEEGIDFQVESLKILAKKAKKHKLSIMYESLDGKKDTLENVEAILSKVPEIFFHIDIGHVNVHGRKPEEFIKKLKDRLVHVHMHDNDGSKDLHIPIGCGNIDWNSLIKTLKNNYDGTITLEIFSQDKDYVLMAKDKLKKMWIST